MSSTAPPSSLAPLRGPVFRMLWLAWLAAPLLQWNGWHPLDGPGARFLALLGLGYAMELAGWRLIGDAALQGRLDLGWLSAWLLLLFSLLPLRWLGGWVQACIALDAGRLLKQRLLTGALRMKLDAVKHQGAGQLLGVPRPHQLHTRQP